MKSSIMYVSYLFMVLVFLANRIFAEGELFKINKLNLIWSKAQHSLGPTKLKDLKRDLIKHELEELALKKLKAHNQDKDGLFEASTRKKLLSILTKYSLDKYYDDIQSPTTDKHKRDDSDNSKTESLMAANQKQTFRDKKLDKLWRKTEQYGFNQEQLMVLYEEFEHLQKNLDEHHETMNDLELEIDRRAKDSEANINSLEGNSMMKESPGEKKSRLEDNIHQDLKDKYSDIKRNYHKLHKKVVDRAIATVDGPFEEDQVNKLWSDAQHCNFTEKELESLEDELGHYETRIKKLKHFEKQLEREAISPKEISSRESDHDLIHIRKRVVELTTKVEKTHKTLEKKIADRRDEL